MSFISTIGIPFKKFAIFFSVFQSLQCAGKMFLSPAVGKNTCRFCCKHYFGTLLFLCTIMQGAIKMQGWENIPSLFFATSGTFTYKSMDLQHITILTRRYFFTKSVLVSCGIHDTQIAKSNKKTPKKCTNNSKLSLINCRFVSLTFASSLKFLSVFKER